MKRHLSLTLILALAPGVAASAAPIAPLKPAPVKPIIPAADAATAPAETPQVRLEAGEGGTKTSNYDTGMSELNGNVTITQDGEDFILYAQKVVNSDRKKQATATGDLRVETRDSTIRAVKMFADFNTKIISMVDSVVISSYGEGDGIQTDGTDARRAEQKRKPVRIACDRLDWNYETKQATLVGNIRIVQGDSVGTCNQIIYDEPKNAARLLGDVNFGNKDSQKFLTDELTLFVDSGVTQTNAGIRLVGPVTNVGDSADKPAVKPTKSPQAFPEPAKIGDAEFPAPPPDIEQFLPRPGVPPAPGKTPAKPPTKPAEKPVAKAEPEKPIVEAPVTKAPIVETPQPEQK